MTIAEQTVHLNTTAQRLGLAAKRVFNQQRGEKAKIEKMVAQGELSSHFAQTNFTSAAAYEVAVQRLMLTEDFVDNELLGLPDDEIDQLVDDRITQLTEQLMQAISLNMNTSDIQLLNGTKIALAVYLDCRRKTYR